MSDKEIKESGTYENCMELLTEEHKWLSMILDEELGKKYYNLHKHHFGHWSNNEEMKRTIGQKISSSPYRAIRIGLANKGKKPAQKTLDANIQKLKGKSYEEKKNRCHRNRCCFLFWIG